MLHAFRRGKSRLYKRYLGHREEGEHRVCEEDEITALILGPMDYLPAEAVGIFWKAVIEQGSRGLPHAFPLGPAVRTEMHFWPRRSIEPDLLIELHWADGARRWLLVELKWKAPLSGDDQLQLQWREFLTPAEREEAYHLFIAPEISAGLNALGKEDIWDGRLLLRSWVSILHVLQHLNATNSAGFDKWKAQVVHFLGQLGIKPFRGFTSLLSPQSAFESPIFWSSLGGFAQFRPPAVPPSTGQLLFFSWSSEQ